MPAQSQIDPAGDAEERRCASAVGAGRGVDRPRTDEHDPIRDGGGVSRGGERHPDALAVASGRRVRDGSSRVTPRGRFSAVNPIRPVEPARRRMVR